MASAAMHRFVLHDAPECSSVDAPMITATAATAALAAILLLAAFGMTAAAAWYLKQLRRRRAEPPAAEAVGSSGALAAAAAAAAAGRYPWNLSGGSYTELQAATARLAVATLLHGRLGGGDGAVASGAGRGHQRQRHQGISVVPHVSGLADLIELVGEQLVPRPEAARAAAEEALYSPGWFGPSWMDTSDACGGFRQLAHFKQFRLAVSASGRLQQPGDVRALCPAPDGWRIATSADILAAGMRRFAPPKSPAQYYYMDQGGWTCCTWPERARHLPGSRGVERIYFLTADWAEVEPADGGALHAQYTEGTLTGSFSSASLRTDLPRGLFGGTVCVRADTPPPLERTTAAPPEE